MLCFRMVICCIFFIGFVVVVGGVVFGMYVVKCLFDNLLFDQFFDGELVIMFYVKIDGDGVILIMLCVDKGQGVYLIQVYLIVEEFDVDLYVVCFLLGLFGLVYYNVNLFKEGVFFFQYD